MIPVEIVAHIDRLVMAEDLGLAVAARHIAYDDGKLGCDKNHRRVWQHHADNAESEWSVVLEDDAVPVRGFRHQLDQALAVAPTPIVSLYLGMGRPKHWQHRVAQATHKANRSAACWVTSTHLLHAVGVAIRTSLLPSLLHWLPQTTIPIDEAISVWAAQYDLPIAYTWPSLVDHADEPTLVDHGNSPDRPRIAWNAAPRDRWTTNHVRM